MSDSRRLPLAASLLVLLVAACAASASTAPSQPGASSSAAPSASAGSASAGAPASGEAPTSAEEAAALVIGANQDFLGFKAKDPDAIGQCCWWTASPTTDGYRVVVHAGWGDCPSGCIENHEWVYTVSSAGEVKLEEETGDPVPAGGIPAGGY